MNSTPVDPTHSAPSINPDPRLGKSTEGSTRSSHPEAEVRARNESLGEMFAGLAERLSTLFRQEIKLAKAEATASAKQAGTGIGLITGAAIGGFFVLMFLSLALTWALGNVMNLGWAALAVAIIWAVIAAVLAVLGKKRLEKMQGMPQTQESLQEIPPTLNPSKETP